MQSSQRASFPLLLGMRGAQLSKAPRVCMCLANSISAEDSHGVRQGGCTCGIIVHLTNNACVLFSQHVPGNNSNHGSEERV